MKRWFYKTLAQLKGKNPSSMPVDLIVDQMLEPRPLPLGMQEFEQWSDRIISGSLLKAEPDSQKFALATMLMHLSPTTDHECDGYFIKSLRKSAINQIADAKMRELRDKAKQRLEEQQKAEAAAATQADASDGKEPA